MDKVKFDIDCKERVAFDLMLRIRDAEVKNNNTLKKDRPYYLTLYRECLHAILYPRNPKDKN